MSPRLVIFDWDGTLTDSVARITATIALAIERAGLPARSAAEIREIIGLGMLTGIGHLYPQAPAAAKQALSRVHADPDIRDRIERPAPLFPRVPALLDDLEGDGTLLAIATGKGRESLARDLGASGVADRFTVIRSADDGPGKPAPWMVEEILECTGSRPGEAIVVGDTLYDLQMAAAAGVDAVAVSWGVHPRERLMEAAPRAVVDRIEDLPGILRATAAANLHMEIQSR